jgi:hypothetical protein
MADHRKRGRKNDDPIEGKMLYNYNKTNFPSIQIHFKVRQSSLRMEKKNQKWVRTRSTNLMFASFNVFSLSFRHFPATKNKSTSPPSIASSTACNTACSTASTYTFKILKFPVKKKIVKRSKIIY